MNDKTEIKVNGALCSNTAHNRFVSVRFHRTSEEIFLRFRNEAGRLLHGYLQFDGVADVAKIIIEGMEWQDPANLTEEEKEFYDHFHDENGERYYRRQYQVICGDISEEFYPEVELKLAVMKFQDYIIEYPAEEARIIIKTYRTKESFEQGAVDDEEILISYPFI